MITVNANDQVLVSLTQEGNHILKKSYDDHNNSYKALTGKYPKPMLFPDGDLATGYVRMTLWELVELFGPHMHMGGDTFFSLKIPEATDAH